MKKVLLVVLAIGFTATLACASVSGIKSNGDINGSASYQVQCSSGSSYIIYKSGGSWYRGDSGHMGNKYDSWSRDDVANFVCN